MSKVLTVGLIFVIMFVAVNPCVFADNEPKVVLGENVHEVWDLIRDCGYSEVATAAIMGNFHRESRGLIPYSMEGFTAEQAKELDDSVVSSRQNFVYQNGGYGLAGWTGISNLEKLWDFCEENGYKPNTIDGQIAFFDDGFRGRADDCFVRMDTYYEPKDIVIATEDFRQSYEASVRDIGSQYMRCVYAKAIYRECTDNPDTIQDVDDVDIYLDVYMDIDRINSELGLGAYKK